MLSIYKSLFNKAKSGNGYSKIEGMEDIYDILKENVTTPKNFYMLEAGPMILEAKISFLQMKSTRYLNPVQKILVINWIIS